MIVQKIEECTSVWDDSAGTVRRSWLGGDIVLEHTGTHFGYVLDGYARVSSRVGEFIVPAGCYFCLPGNARLSGAGRALLVTRIDYDGIFLVGGPIEARGRLRYINGCSDSVLIAPLRLGDPCLNLLHIPADIDQTAHTHPSTRVGLIVSGSGRCVWPTGEAEMNSGDVFVLTTGVVHSFHTGAEDMRIVVYHPDSDCGPSDDVHPMVNRTLVNGIPANQISEIRTSPSHFVD